MKYCEKNKPCQNGGSCTNLNGSFACTCQAGYFGKNCENQIKTCQPNSCQNNGQCIEVKKNKHLF